MRGTRLNERCPAIAALGWRWASEFQDLEHVCSEITPRNIGQQQNIGYVPICWPCTARVQSIRTVETAISSNLKRSNFATVGMTVTMTEFDCKGRTRLLLAANWCIDSAIDLMHKASSKAAYRRWHGVEVCRVKRWEPRLTLGSTSPRNRCA